MSSTSSQNTKPSTIIISKKTSSSKPTGRIGVFIEASSVLVGNFTAKNELTVFLALKDSIKINSDNKNSLPPSEFSLKVLLKEEARGRYVVCFNKITFPLSSEHILAIYFIKISSMLQKLNISPTEEIIIVSSASGVFENSTIQRSLAIVKSGSPSDLFPSQYSYKLATDDGSDRTSKFDTSSSFSVVETLLQFLDLTNDVTIETGEFDNYTVGPPGLSDLSPELVEIIERNIARAVQEGLKAHRKLMYSVTDKREPFTDNELKTFHDRNLQSIAKHFAENFEELASSFSSLASCIKDAQQKLERKINLQLTNYLKRYENSMQSVTEKVKYWVLEAECLYDEQMEEFNPEKRTCKEIKTKHAELEKQFMDRLKQKFIENHLEWQEFWKFEPQAKLDEKLEELVATANENISNFGDKLSSLSSPMLVLKSIQRVRNSSLSYENSHGTTPMAPPNSFSNFEDSASFPDAFTRQDENYLKDQSNYEDSTITPLDVSNFEERADSDSEVFNREEEEPILQFEQDVSHRSDILEQNSSHADELEDSIPENINVLKTQSEEIVDDLLEPVNESVEVQPSVELHSGLSINVSTEDQEIETETSSPEMVTILETGTETKPIDKLNGTTQNIVVEQQSLDSSSIQSENLLTEDCQSSIKNSQSEITRLIEDALQETSQEDTAKVHSISSTAHTNNGAHSELVSSKSFSTNAENVAQGQDFSLEVENDVTGHLFVDNKNAITSNLQQPSELALASTEPVVTDFPGSPPRSSHHGNMKDGAEPSESADNIRYEIESSEEDVPPLEEDFPHLGEGVSPLEDVPPPPASPVFTDHNLAVNNVSTQVILDEILEESSEMEGDSSIDSNNNPSDGSSGPNEDFAFISLQDVPEEASASYDNLASIDVENSLIRSKTLGHSGSTQSLPEKTTKQFRASKRKFESKSSRLIYESTLNINKL